MGTSRWHKVNAGLLAIGLFAVSVALAGIRGAGEYNGVIIFDRWGACYLYSGIYLMPISEKIKESLRVLDGKPVRIDAEEVYQPMNPGDGLIQKLRLLGPATEPSGPTASRHVVHDDITMTVVPDFSTRNQLTLELKNDGTARREINLDALGPTILAKKKQDEACLNFLATCPFAAFDVADGPSEALITRCSLANSCFHDGRGITLAAESELPKSIAPMQTIHIPLLFQLPPGEYQFLAGYGGGVHEARALVSNRISFDVDEGGRAHLTAP